MSPYMLVIRAEPSTDNRYYGKIGPSRFHIWVISESISEAESRSIGYVVISGWIPIEIEYEFQITSEQLPHLHKDESALLAKARAHGISADIIAAPLQEGTPGDPVMLLPPS